MTPFEELLKSLQEAKEARNTEEVMRLTRRIENYERETNPETD